MHYSLNHQNLHSLKINKLFISIRTTDAAAPCLWNHLPETLLQPHLNYCLRIHFIPNMSARCPVLPPANCRQSCLSDCWIAGAKVWNSLPDDVTAAPSLSTFRRHLKTHLIRCCYNTLWFCSSAVLTLTIMVLVVALLLRPLWNTCDDDDDDDYIH